MDKLPLSVYDFFAYLSSGFVTLVGVAAAFTGSDDWQETPGAIVGILLLVIAYAVGHVVANISGFFLEGVIVRRWLKRPSVNLLRSTPPRWAWLFPGYARPLPASQQERITKRARTAGVPPEGEGLFFHCFGLVKQHESVMSRLETFLNLYGFCRNMCLAALIVGVALVIGSVTGSAKTGPLVSPGWWAAGCLVAAVALFYRYLKFLRHYTLEVFVSYAEPQQAAHSS